MSAQITTAFVEQYKANVMLLTQQKNHRFAGAVRLETGIVGKRAFFEQIGATEAVKKTSRHGDTPLMNTPHARRALTLATYHWADLIDSDDKIRMLIDPSSSYAMSAAAAMNRAKDDVIIAAALGTAYTGEEGTTTVALPSSQKVVHGSAGLSIAKLLSAREILYGNDVDEEIPLHIAVTQKQLSDLLVLTEVKSADYNSVKALVRGEIDTYLGFKFHRSQRLTNDATPSRQVIAWAEDGILLGVGEDVKAKITERPDKNHATQVYFEMTIGSTRMEEKKVVEIACNE